MSVLTRPGVAPLFLSSVVARIPQAAVGVVLLVHARELTGSFAAAGLVMGFFALAQASGAPVLGRLVDRRGQTAVLLASSSLCAAALATLALLPNGTPLAALVALAILAGASQPPLGACLRTLWPAILDGPEEVRAAYALEAAALELTYISGPLAALAVATAWSTAAGVALTAGLLAAGATAFAAMPASRAWRPHGERPAARGGALRAGGIRTLLAALAAVGLLLGAVEVAVPAFARAEATAGATGPLLALWGVGSMLGGLLAARTGGLRGTRGLVAGLLALGAGHAALAVAATPAALGALLVVAGAAIAPCFAAVYALVDDLAVPGTVTEAFAWLSTALGAGLAAGSALAGVLAEGPGPWASFLLGGLGGVLAATALVVGARAPAPVPSAPCASGATAASPSPSAPATATR